MRKNWFQYVCAVLMMPTCLIVSAAFFMVMVVASLYAHPSTAPLSSAFEHNMWNVVFCALASAVGMTTSYAAAVWWQRDGRHASRPAWAGLVLGACSTLSAFYYAVWNLNWALKAGAIGWLKFAATAWPWAHHLLLSLR